MAAFRTAFLLVSYGSYELAEEPLLRLEANRPQSEWFTTGRGALSSSFSEPREVGGARTSAGCFGRCIPNTKTDSVGNQGESSVVLSYPVLLSLLRQFSSLSHYALHSVHKNIRCT